MSNTYKGSSLTLTDKNLYIKRAIHLTQVRPYRALDSIKNDQTLGKAGFLISLWTRQLHLYQRLTATYEPQHIGATCAKWIAPFINMDV